MAGMAQRRRLIELVVIITVLAFGVFGGFLCTCEDVYRNSLRDPAVMKI